MTTVYARLQSRRDTAANWTAANPVLAEGEIGFITDTKAAKIGDGVTAWNDLLTRPSQEQLVAVQAAAEQAAADADQRLTATVAAQTATETARDETQTLRDQTYGYKQDVASAIVYQDLASIAASKNLTMVAGCVYDTRLDTDGGAWRERCHGTSWYNEPLNTATRGSRREFPTVAVIIVEASKITIFDGDDPTMPMWWSRARAGTSIADQNWWRGTQNATSISAKNGQVFISNDGVGGYPSGGLMFVDFAGDNRGRYGSSSSWDGLPANSGDSDADLPNKVAATIASYICNSVAMTVQPDAPVAATTGLQVPTIAVATHSGVSVVNNDGSVADSSLTIAFQRVRFEGETLIMQRNASGRVDAVTDYSTDGFDADGTRSYADTTTPAFLGNVEQGLSTHKGTIVQATNKGVSILSENPSSPEKGMVHYLTSTWISGWQPGDIRGAFLASTDHTDLSDANLLSNGDFSSDLTTWAPVVASGVVVDGAVKVAHDSSLNAGRLIQRETLLEPNSAYLVSWDTVEFFGDTTSIAIRVGDANANNSNGFAYASTASFTGTGPQQATVLTGPGTPGYLGFFVGGTFANGGGVSIDNVVFQKLSSDRSVNKKPLIPHGTVPRAPVATGAELMAYSGFSSINYLEQPYNPDLEFGTGDFCVMGWARDAQAWSTMISKAIAGGAKAFAFEAAGTVNTARVVINDKFINNLNFPWFTDWTFCSLVRKNGVITIAQNGIVTDSDSTSDAAGTVSLPGAPLLIGRIQGTNVTTDYWKGKLTLWRIGATAPTAAQIAKIYRDERRLFQPGAACTLYGSSDVVTALAHDPVTGLLHAGTNAGRSDFDGLLRVGNTTTPVAAAIAASGGMILEG